ncbi:MAG TPA: peptide MFS transporter [Candidatus Polarisedimenticolaceae bacterium]|nr:peptide MFS transporter [Candidatus Polarisedimenticolaceae bacterium]
MSPHSERPDIPATEFIGHPLALWQLFNIEMWERFAYYGMRAVLAPYVALVFFGHLASGEANAEASLVYGGYTALVYATGIAGGYVADKILGFRRAILLGALIMASGLFKPNISTMVGQLYAPGDVRRDSGFTIFYMGINLGALLAPLVTAAWIGAIFGLKWGFFAAGIGMILSTLFLQLAKRSLGSVGLPPEGKEGWGRFFVVAGAALLSVPVIYFLLSESAVLGYILIGIMFGLAIYLVVAGIRSGDKVQLHRYIVMLILFVANAFFWSLFEQAGSSLNFLAKDFVDLDTGLFTMNFAVFQSANPMFILLLAPLFAMLWPKLDRYKMNPSIPRKFGLGLIQVGFGFYVLVFAIGNMQDANGLIPWSMLLLCYFFHTTGELCLSPIGLSMVTKLAERREVGLAMGGWFLSIAMAQYVAGLIAAVASGGEGGHAEAASSITQYASVYWQLFWFGLIAGFVYLLVAPLLNKLMHGVR